MPTVEFVTPVLVLAVFLGLYQYLRIRAEGPDGRRPPVQWGWLAAILGAAAIALILGAVTE